MTDNSQLYGVQSDFGHVANLISALDIMVRDMSEPATGRLRQQLDALIGVSAAIARQMEATMTALDALPRQMGT